MIEVIIINNVKLEHITGVTADSRDVRPGYAFVAVSGFKEDGNKYIKDAINRGAALVLTEQEFQGNYGVPIIRVKNAREKLARLAALKAGNPSKQLELIGITGTNGKTTTTYLIHHILNQSKKPTGLLGTIEYKIGQESIPSKLTTPDSSFIQSFLSQLIERDNQAAVMEVSSHGIKLKRVYSLDFDIAIFTNLTPDHFDLHPDFQDYLGTKKSWFDNLKKDACVIYNNDDPFSKEMVGDSPASTKIPFSMQGNGMITGDNRQLSANGISLDINVNQEIVGTAGKIGNFTIKPHVLPIRIGMLGNHNCYNLLTAVTASLVAGVSPDIIKNSVGDFKGVWRRMQIIYQKPFMVIDDASHNPNNFQAVFDAVKQLSYNNIWALVGIRGNRGWQINYENAKLIGQYVRDMGIKLLVSKSKDTNGLNDQLLADEEQAFIKGLWERGVHFELYETLEEGTSEVTRKLEPGDILLLLGAHPFDEAGQKIIPKLNERVRSLHARGLISKEESQPDIEPLRYN